MAVRGKGVEVVTLEEYLEAQEGVHIYIGEKQEHIHKIPQELCWVDQITHQIV